jgi:hypothetical protein
MYINHQNVNNREISREHCIGSQRKNVEFDTQ